MREMIHVWKILSRAIFTQDLSERIELPRIMTCRSVILMDQGH